MAIEEQVEQVLQAGIGIVSQNLEENRDGSRFSSHDPVQNVKYFLSFLNEIPHSLSTTVTFSEADGYGPGDERMHRLPEIGTQRKILSRCQPCQQFIRQLDAQRSLEWDDPVTLDALREAWFYGDYCRSESSDSPSTNADDAPPFRYRLHRDRQLKESPDQIDLRRRVLGKRQGHQALGDRGDSGPQVPPGRYTVTVRFGEHEAQGSIRVLADPRASNSDAEWEAREAAIRRAGALQNRLAEAVERIAEVRSDLDVILAKAKPAGEEKTQAGGGGEEEENPHRELIAAIKELGKELTAIEERLRIPPGTKGIVSRQRIDADIDYALECLLGDWAPPTPSDLLHLERAELALAAVLEDLNRLFAEDLAAVRSRFQASGLSLLKEFEPLAVESATAADP